MAFYSELTVINGVLAQFAETPVGTVGETKNSQIISDSLQHYLPLFIKSTFDWAFLKKDVKLSTVVEGLSTPLWQYAFLLPADSVRVTKVQGSPKFEIREPYLYINSTEVTLTYISFSNDYARFPAHFVDYLIYFVALKLAIPLTRDSELARAIEEMGRVARTKAQATELRLKSGDQTLLNPRSRMINRLA